MPLFTLFLLQKTKKSILHETVNLNVAKRKISEKQNSYLFHGRERERERERESCIMFAVTVFWKLYGKRTICL